jgi:hypothetical protein
LPLDHLKLGEIMFIRKWVFRALVLVIASAVLGGAVTGCESTGGGGGPVGSDGHAGHNH